jgi:exonuclease SbcC
MLLRLKQLQATSEATKTQRSKLPNTTDIQNQIVIQLGAKNLLVNQANMFKSAQAEMAQIENAQRSLDALPPQTADVASLDRAIAELEKSIRLAEDYERKAKAWEDAGKAVMALGNIPNPPELPFTDAQLADLSEKAEAYRKAFSEASANYRFYDDLARTLRDKPLTECPICGGPVKDLQRIKRKMDEYNLQLVNVQIVNYPAQQLDATTKQERIKASYVEAMTRYNAKHAMLLEQFQKTEAAVRATVPMAEAAGQLREKLRQLQVQKQEAVNIGISAGLYKHTAESSRQRLVVIQTELKSVDQQLLPFKATTVEQIDALLANLSTQMKMTQEFDQQLAALDGMIRELSINLKSLENTTKILEDKRAGLGTYLDSVKVLTSVRDWFHYSNGPHALATAVLQEMNQDVNNFLGQFSAPFSVIQGSDALGFRCIFHDGRNTPSEPPEAYHLSGGQKIQLAIAFRFASYCMFANKLGLLSLDEPTVYLDAQNVGAFCTLLQKIKEVAQKMNLQVIIATHERAVMPFIDTVINLSE